MRLSRRGKNHRSAGSLAARPPRNEEADPRTSHAHRAETRPRQSQWRRVTSQRRNGALTPSWMGSLFLPETVDTAGTTSMLRAVRGERISSLAS